MTRSNARKTPSRRRGAGKAALTPQNLLLAGLGAVSLTRKQALQALADAADGVEQLRARADDAAREAGSRVARLRKQARARLAPVQKQAAAFADQAQAEFEARLAPVLVKFGVKPAARRPARKPSTRRTRPAAKRTRKRA